MPSTKLYQIALDSEVETKDKLRALLRALVGGTVICWEHDLAQVEIDEATEALMALVAGLGESLFDRLLEKHGVDRYPTVDEQLNKVYGELDELNTAVEDAIVSITMPRDEKGVLAQVPVDALDTPEIRGELGDVGLSLYGLAKKLGQDLHACMQGVVAGETRTDADGTLKPGL